MNNSSQLNQAHLDKAVEQLPSEMSPNRDLWPGIEKAIANKQQHLEIQKQSHWRINLALAASVCALAITLVNMNGWHNPTQQLTAVSQMTQVFEQERQAMLVSYQQQALEPNEVSADLQKQLDELVKARKSIVSALEKDPQNADLIHLLRFTQQQELSLLNHIYRPKWQTI